MSDLFEDIHYFPPFRHITPDPYYPSRNSKLIEAERAKRWTVDNDEAKSAPYSEVAAFLV